jgi:hypothetical protein
MGNSNFQTGYQTLERIMETKAKEKGQRRKFFQFLQKARVQAIREHPHCEGQFRHWLADSLTWKLLCECLCLSSSTKRLIFTSSQ